ncbi:MAG: DUF3179 domain-containing protein [Deltaproteobacteria bacterium]|nr:DUF3179 domain-containing protein [Deltaproteobacteria bacterium]
MKKLPPFLLILLAVFILGFDFSKHSIPVEEIRSGGPGKDGIPSIADPKFLTADKAGFLKDSDRVIGIEISGVAKAYPVRILNWHEAVNDRIGNSAILVTW